MNELKEQLNRIDREIFILEMKDRFDKPHVAECYCKEYIHWNTDKYECNRQKRYEIYENSFCNEAKPRKKVE